MKLSDLGEFNWLQRLLPRLFWPRHLRKRLVVPPGDDAGVISVSADRVLVATVDMLVEGVHFERSWTSWDALGHKLLAINLSDLAAMGHVKPLCAVIGFSAPGRTPSRWVNEFYRGLERCARRWGVGLLGGDTVGSKNGLSGCLFLLGEARRRDLVRRSGAREGDWIAVTGPLGEAATGLEVLQRRSERLPWTRPLVKRFQKPEPRLKEGAALGSQHLATSMIDCSDGLEPSILFLCQASRVGARIHLDRLPYSEPLARWSRRTGRPGWDYALGGGEDYELVFTFRPDRLEPLKRFLPGATVIGEVRPAREGVWGITGDRRIAFQRKGYSHFRHSKRS